MTCKRKSHHTLQLPAHVIVERHPTDRLIFTHKKTLSDLKLRSFGGSHMIIFYFQSFSSSSKAHDRFTPTKPAKSFSFVDFFSSATLSSNRRPTKVSCFRSEAGVKKPDGAETCRFWLFPSAEIGASTGFRNLLISHKLLISSRHDGETFPENNWRLSPRKAGDTRTRNMQHRFLNW